MKAQFFSYDNDAQKHLRGEVTLENGVALIPPELEHVNRTMIVQPNTLKTLHPTDGADYIRALPYTFRANGYTSVNVVE